MSLENLIIKEEDRNEISEAIHNAAESRIMDPDYWIGLDYLAHEDAE